MLTGFSEIKTDGDLEHVEIFLPFNRP